jgi:radical SAM-linked protein
MSQQRYRVRYHKGGDLRLLSHRDMLRLLERLFRRGELDLAMSQGFHPKPIMSFPLALGLGIEGRNEVMELELAKAYDAEDLRQILNEHAPEGLMFTSIKIPTDKRSQVFKTEYLIPLPATRTLAISEAIAKFLGQEQWLVERVLKDKKRRSRSGPKTKTVNLRDGVETLAVEGDTIRMTLLEILEASVRPRDVLEAIEALDLEQDGGILVRTNVILSDEMPASQSAEADLTVAGSE